MENIRINRYLAMCGQGSRRTCEQLVESGRVTINGTVVHGLGQRVGPKDKVQLDGDTIKPEREQVVLLFKPRGAVCTRMDPQERTTVYDFLPPEFHSLAHVGRLDRESEGLLVMTNDGNLAHRLTHPSSKVEKEYLVQIDKAFDVRDRQRLLDGIATEEGMAYAVAVEALAQRLLRIVLQQGIKRQIRLMLAELGYEVRQLARTRIGSLEDSKLKPGKWRKLNERDIALLQENPYKPKAGKAGTVALPPPPTPKGRRPAVKAAAGAGLRSPGATVRGVGKLAKPGVTTEPAKRGAADGPGKRGKANATRGKAAAHPAGKKQAGGRPAAKKSKRPSTAPKRGAKRTR